MTTNFIQEALNELRAEAKTFDSLKDEQLLAPIFIKYRLQQGEYRPADYRSQITDGKNDGGIDAVVVGEELEGELVYLIQAKNTDSFDKEQASNAANKIRQSIEKWKAGSTTLFNAKLTKALHNADDCIQGRNKVEISIVTTASIPTKKRAVIEKHLSDDESLRPYYVSLHSREDLEKYIEAIYKPARSVPEDSIKINTSIGELIYSPTNNEADKDKCMIVSASAKSLKRLHNLYHENGLFGQNLREYITAKKQVDNALRDTIRKDPKYFWIKNNGITIGCRDYYPDGNKLTLYDFSIINGAQTTTRISNEDFSDDFQVLCKVIREDNEERFDQFAEAANAQKPITDRDLKANRPEQRQLKEDLHNQEPKIFLEIKRSAARKLNKREREQKNLRSWQFISNYDYGKLVLAFYAQEPFTSYGNPGNIFSHESTYKKIFHRRDVDYQKDIDLLRAHDVYLQWKDEFPQRSSSSHDSEEEGIKEEIIKFGKFSFIANMRLLFFFPVIKRMLSKEKDCDLHDAILKSTATGKLFDEETPASLDLPDEHIKVLKGLFERLLDIHGYAVQQENKSPQQIYKDRVFCRKISSTIYKELTSRSYSPLKNAYEHARQYFIP